MIESTTCNSRALTCLMMAVWASFTRSGLDSPSTTSAAVPSLESVSMMATPTAGDAGVVESSSWPSSLADERPWREKESTGLDLVVLGHASGQALSAALGEQPDREKERDEDGKLTVRSVKTRERGKETDDD